MSFPHRNSTETCRMLKNRSNKPRCAGTNARLGTHACGCERSFPSAASTCASDVVCHGTARNFRVGRHALAYKGHGAAPFLFQHKQFQLPLALLHRQLSSRLKSSVAMPPSTYGSARAIYTKSLTNSPADLHGPKAAARKAVVARSLGIPNRPNLSRRSPTSRPGLAASLSFLLVEYSNDDYAQADLLTKLFRDPQPHLPLLSRDSI